MATSGAEGKKGPQSLTLGENGEPRSNTPRTNNPNRRGRGKGKPSEPLMGRGLGAGVVNPDPLGDNQGYHTIDGHRES